MQKFYIVRKFTYIFILLFYVGFTQINAKTGYSFVIRQYFELNIFANNLLDKLPKSYINTKDFPSSNKFQFVKTIRQRGIVVLSCLVDVNAFIHVNFFEKKLIYSSQTSYFLRIFFSNEKRGPPSV